MTNDLENKRLKNNYSCMNFTSVHAQLSRIWRLFIFSYNLIAIVWSMGNSMKHCTKHGLNIVTLSHYLFICIAKILFVYSLSWSSGGRVELMRRNGRIAVLMLLPEFSVIYFTHSKDKKKMSDSFQEKYLHLILLSLSKPILTSSSILKTSINNLQEKRTFLKGSMLSA